eukprot:15440136-Alexandrium_andersonii.AAC.1
MLYLFTVACRQMCVDVGDMNAFAQSDSMRRSGGDIWVGGVRGPGVGPWGAHPSQGACLRPVRRSG